MSQNIKPGDLVMVIRPTLCCGRTVGLGTVHTVLAVHPRTRYVCGHCGVGGVTHAIECAPGYGYQPGRLMRIAPSTRAAIEKEHCYEW